MIEINSFMLGLGIGALIIGMIGMISKHYYEKTINKLISLNTSSTRKEQ